MRNTNEETEFLFKGKNLVSVRQEAMKVYKNKLLSKFNGGSIKRQTAFPVSVYLIEEKNGEREYYPITGKELHEMERGWQIEGRIMQERNPLNAFFE